MAVKSQGTDLYALVPSTGEFIDVGCITSLDGIDSSIDQIETTCLNDQARSYESGLATPGTATFGINVDPSDANHIRLHQLKTSGTTLRWAIGWRQQRFIDGLEPKAVPTAVVNSDGDYDFDLPPERAWLVFDGYMSSYPFTFGQNAVVQSSIGIQISGDPVLVSASVS
jgi:hypothetical protein